VEDAAGLARGSLAEVAVLTPVRPLSSERARDIIAGYLEAIGRLTDYIDRWTANDR
jgi:hypothetical protein